MIFHTDNLICTVEELRSAIEDREFITYATVNSFRVASRLPVDFKFVADGWPVAVYSSIRLRKVVQRLSFFKCERFWLDIARSRRAALVGHLESELKDIEKRAGLKGIYFQRLISGYAEPEDIANHLKRLAGEVDDFNSSTVQTPFSKLRPSIRPEITTSQPEIEVEYEMGTSF